MNSDHSTTDHDENHSQISLFIAKGKQTSKGVNKSEKKNFK